jgi:hypothetical protein
MSGHSSSARPFASFNEYRLLMTRLAFNPNGRGFRRVVGVDGDDEFGFEDFIPMTALIISAFLAWETSASCFLGVQRQFGFANNRGGLTY